ncbi:MAG TPA: IS1 family transposase [Candidatus Sulfotelmatobacter sp.]
MTCLKCQHQTCKRFGYFGKRRIQRWRCHSCHATFADPTAPKAIGTHYTDPVQVSQAITLMLEGMSVRAISRFTGLHKQTILSLMTTAAEKAKSLLDAKVQNIRPRFVQMDELWGFVHTKEHNLGWDDPKEWGTAYLWLALDSETKLIITHHIGGRNSVSAFHTAFDLRNRTVGRYQITSDSLKSYVGAIKQWYGRDVDFAQLHKIYGKISSSDWYGSGRVIGAVPHVKIGRPDFKRISTSHIERANLSVRMHLRRLTRLTNAFSKKLENHKAAITLYVAFYNFCRPHQTHKGATPAMAAGLTDHVWTIAELLGAA